MQVLIVYFSKGGNGSIDFAGLRYDEGIASIAINVPRSDYLAIDNFIFEPVAPVIIPITTLSPIRMTMISTANLAAPLFPENTRLSLLLCL